MVKKFFFVLIGIVSGLAIVCASGWHPAEQIYPGTFQSGDFEFDGSVNVTSGNDFCIDGGSCLSSAGGGSVSDDWINESGDSTGDLTSDLNIDSDTFVVSYDDNRVGIGTDNPWGILHASSSNDWEAIFHLEDTANSYSYPSLYLKKSRGAGSLNDWDIIGSVSYDGMNSNLDREIFAEVVGGAVDVTDGSEDGLFEVFTMIGGTLREVLSFSDGEMLFNHENLDLDFIVDSQASNNSLFVQGDTGNVGIGINNPSEKLEVDGNIIADVPTANNHVATKAYVDASSGSGTYYEYGSSGANYCSGIDIDTGEFIEINDDKLCDYNLTNAGLTNLYKCWDGNCLEEDEGGTAYCRDYNYSDGTWIAANEGEVAFHTKTCNSGSLSSEKFVFVTSNLYNGYLGGLDGADSKCEAEALAADLPGTYKAWLSTGAAITTRFTTSTNDYILVDGTVVANGWSDLVDGNLDHAINMDAQGNTYSGSVVVSVWTNLDDDGSSSGVSCNFWSDNTSSYSGGCGVLTSTMWTWSDSSSQGCDSSARLYCFEQ